jgi:hypothetical protein
MCSLLRGAETTSILQSEWEAKKRGGKLLYEVVIGYFTTTTECQSVQKPKVKARVKVMHACSDLSPSVSVCEGR